MTYRLPGASSPEDLTARRKELAYCDGYDTTTGMTAQTSDTNTTETDLPVFGTDDNISGTNVTSANIAMTILEQNEKSNGFLRLIHNMRPTTNPLNSPAQYRGINIAPVNVLILRKSNDDSKVIMSRFYKGWQPAEKYPEGGADDKAQRAYTGKSAPAREFDGLSTCDLLTSGESTLRSTPFLVPNENAAVYAYHIEALNFPGQDFSSTSAEREAIKAVTPGMVSSTGVIDWPTVVAEATLSSVNALHVYYLLSGVTGIPETNTTIEPEGMRGAPLTT